MDPNADATQVDWSMGFGASRLADWTTAKQVGRRIAGPGPRVLPVDRARMRENFAEIVPRSQDLIADFTGLTPGGFRPRAWVMGRGEWISANLTGLERLLEPVADRVLAGRRTEGSGAELRRKAMGAQAGVLLGYVARRVLGQYDAFLPPDDAGLLYIVGPNIAEAETKFGLDPGDFRLWVALHEVTHRVQFGVAPWLVAHLRGLIDEYLGAVSTDPREILAQLRRAADEVRAGADLRGEGILLLLNPEQREVFERMQGLMSLLEGHASFVMNEVAADHVADLPKMRRALGARRRSANPLERTFQRSIGLTQKLEQYDTGERFVREVVARSGMEGFNLVWTSAERLPSPAEIVEPARWVERVTT